MKEEDITRKVKQIDEKLQLRKINQIASLLDNKKRLLKAKKKYEIKLAGIVRELDDISKNICKGQGHSYSNWVYDEESDYYINTCLECGKTIKSENKPNECIERTLKKKLR